MIRGLAGSVVVGAFAVACATGWLDPKNRPVVVGPEPLQPGDHGVVITGVVRDANTGEGVPEALVVLQCTCLAGQRELRADADGRYRFAKLVPGTYTVQVLKNDANVDKTMAVPADSRFRVDFVVDPEMRFRVT